MTSVISVISQCVSVIAQCVGLARIASARRLGFAALLAFGAAPGLAQQKASVLIDPAAPTAGIETTKVIGRLVSLSESDVAARAAGVVLRVPVDIGDRVSANDVLVELDDEQLAIDRRSAVAALRRAESGVGAAEATLRLRAQNLDRIDRLRGSNAFSRGQFEDLRQQKLEAESQVARARADVDSAHAALARVDYDLKHARIRAPYDGVIVARMANQGEYISVGEAVLSLMQISRLEIEADLPAESIGALQPGDSVEIELGGGERQMALLRALLPRENTRTRTRPARFVMQDWTPPDSVAAGAPVTVYLPLGDAGALLTISKDALVQQGGGWIVYVAVEGAAQLRQVEIGEARGNRVEVLSGLEKGDLVVVRGNERLAPNQPIDPQPVSGQAFGDRSDAGGDSDTDDKSTTPDPDQQG